MAYDEDVAMIWYGLDASWLPDELRGLICRTIARFPEDVQEFAIHNCTFQNFSAELHGQCIPASHFTRATKRGRTTRNHWVILLNEDVESEEAGQHTIAHEIAHAWMARGREASIHTNNLAEEENADELAASWGFAVPESRREVHRAHREAAARSVNPYVKFDKVAIEAAPVGDRTITVGVETIPVEKKTHTVEVVSVDDE